MDTCFNESFPRAPVALAAAIVLVFACAVALVTGWFAPTLEQYRSASAASTPVACGACGVVEFVRVTEPAGVHGGASAVPLGAAAPSFHLSGGRGEGVAILLSALGSAIAARQAPVRRAKVHEVGVRMEDGSVRVLHDAGVPAWTPGARVKVIQGRIVPLS
jgi:outer membrane lipoprotein SlyB